MSLFGKISGAKQALQLLAKVDFADIQRGIALVKAIQDESASLARKVATAIELAQLVAKYTETKTDDQVLAALLILSQSSGFEALVGMVEAMLESGGAVPVASLPEGGFEVSLGEDKEFIPLPVALQVAQIIVSIIIFLRKERK